MRETPELGWAPNSGKGVLGGSAALRTNLAPMKPKAPSAGRLNDWTSATEIDARFARRDRAPSGDTTPTSFAPVYRESIAPKRIDAVASWELSNPLN
jgi:hypothetical protein